MVQKVEQKAVGGFAFFLSLLALVLIDLSNLSAIPALKKVAHFSFSLYFFGAFALGLVIGLFVFTQHLKVFIHELKHALLSGLVGNRWRGMMVKGRSGHFEYAYSSRTARYNAFISLAPYWIPLFTLLFLLIASAAFGSRPTWIMAALGFGYGIDLVCNMRDVSPHQTDFSLIRGGFVVGLIYVIAINLMILSILLTYVFAQHAGLELLVVTIWNWVHALVDRIFPMIYG